MAAVEALVAYSHDSPAAALEVVEAVWPLSERRWHVRPGALSALGEALGAQRSGGKGKICET